MSPPPSTPTPRRFLLAKRGTQLSQTPSAPPKFQPTPWVGSSSVPRPTPWRKERGADDVEEVEDQIEESDFEEESEVDGAEGMMGRGVPLNDSIEIDSEEEVALGDSGEEVDGDDGVEEGEDSPELARPWEGSPIEERESKRRKVSTSPMRDSSPLHLQAQEEDGEHGNEEDSLSSYASPTRDHTPMDDSLEGVPDTITSAQQPTFQAPPRFKPIEADPTSDGLPAAFSPQRRGAKYVPNGLAAGLQGWLSDVKGWEGIDGAAESALSLTVEEVRPGRRMYLVRGQLDGVDGSRRFMLAGEGRLTGLGRRAVVLVGSRVGVGQPVWDVVLEGETWTIACEWSVVS